MCSAFSIYRCRGSQPKHVSNPGSTIKKTSNPHFIYDCVVSGRGLAQPAHRRTRVALRPPLTLPLTLPLAPSPRQLLHCKRAPHIHCHSTALTQGLHINGASPPQAHLMHHQWALLMHHQWAASENAPKNPQHNCALAVRTTPPPPPPPARPARPEPARRNVQRINSTQAQRGAAQLQDGAAVCPPPHPTSRRAARARARARATQN